MYLLVAAWGLAIASPVGASPPGMESDRELDAMLSGRAQRSVDALVAQGKAPPGIQIEARMDLVTRMVIVDVVRGYVPASPGAEMEDFEGGITNDLLDLARTVSPASGALFRYGGKDLYQLFPSEQPVPPKSTFQRDASDAVAVSAGHGVYFHHGFGDWRFQRDPSNGIIEDEVTSSYAAELKRWLEARSSVRVYRLRSDSSALHGPSLQEWWKLAARYRLQVLYPGNPELWNSLPGSTASLRERDEDIRSRPLLANHIGAAAVFHLHTNAAQPSATGARVFYHEGRADDGSLARNTLCYMKELVSSLSRYKNYYFPREGDQGRHGENRLAAMPSIIVEMGFHTNPNDALALQDPLFRTAAMKGVEKAYRLHLEGKGCEPLSVQMITDVTTSPGSRAEVEVHFEGHPQFPVTLDVEPAVCQPGWTCYGGQVVLRQPAESPLRFQVECGAGNGGSSRWRTTMRDADGVAGVATEHQQTCVAAARHDASSVLRPADSNESIVRLVQ